MTDVLPADQVPRLWHFRELHPDITIKPPSKQSALWTACRGETLLAKTFWLEQLLDRLEAIT